MGNANNTIYSQNKSKWWKVKRFLFDLHICSTYKVKLLIHNLFCFTLVLCNVPDTMVEPVPESINFPSEEEKIMQMWDEKNCFQECLKQSKSRPK